MMLFFDYIYYLLCKFYKRFKDERDLNSWRGSGIVMVAGTLSLFCMTIQMWIAEFVNICCQRDELQLYLILLTMSIFILSIIIFIIRYNKFTTYKEIYLKVEAMSKRKVWILDIISLIYFLIAFPGMLATAIYLGSINNP